MKKVMKHILITLIFTAVIGAIAFSFGIKRGSRAESPTKPIEEYLVNIADANYITNYGIDLESRLVYNVAMLNKVVNSQGVAIRQLLEREPNK